MNLGLKDHALTQVFSTVYFLIYALDTTPIVKPRKKRRRKKRTRQAAKSNSLLQKEAENQNASPSISLIQTFFEGFLPLAAVMALIAFVNYVFDHHLASYFLIK